MSGDDHFLRPDNDPGERECSECILPAICLNQGRCLLLEEDVKALENRAMVTDHEMRMYSLDLFEILQAVDHTLTVHGHIDSGTPLHRRITAALAVPNEDPSGQRRAPMTADILDDEPPFSINEHIARDIRDGIFPKKSEE